MECICVPAFVNVGGIEPAAALEFVAPQAAVAPPHELNEVMEREQVAARADDACDAPPGGNNGAGRPQRRAEASNGDPVPIRRDIVPPRLPHPVSPRVGSAGLKALDNVRPSTAPLLAPRPARVVPTVSSSLALLVVHAWIACAVVLVGALLALKLAR